ncbi:MAG: undecaprenyl-diphosphate phosphatase [Lachnospiraceae bacterium]|nr:undecaprenyl-diphosphate phosphatase [Lachnospiraceae bacterium]
MTLLNAILLGLLQGLAEFLPISSSGHLAIFEVLFKVENAGMVFDILLHLGTLLAIFVAYWKDIKMLVVEGFLIVFGTIGNAGRFIINITRKDNKLTYNQIINTPYRKFVVLVIVSTIPTGIIGIVLKDIIDAASSSLLVTGTCLLITGLMLIVSDMVQPGKKKPNQVKYREAGIIGIVQGLATFPGISRSGSTITACLLCGFDKSFAVKYSFIMSIPAVMGAAILELKDFGEVAVTSTELVYYGIGTLVAAVVGYICIKTMLVVVRGKKFKYFAYYCFAIGLFSIIWHLV